MADPSLPTFRCALVKNVVDEDSLRLVFQEAIKYASVVAPYGDEALVADERCRIVSKRDHEHATGWQLSGSSFDEALDGAAVRQVSDRVAHAQDCGRRLCDVALKCQQVIVDCLDRQVATKFASARSNSAEVSIAVTRAPLRASGIECIPKPAPRSRTTARSVSGKFSASISAAPACSAASGPPAIQT